MFEKYILKQISLKKDERIIASLRTHIIHYGVSILIAFILVALPFFFLVPLFRQGFAGIVAFFLLLIAGSLFVFWVFIRWYLNVFVLTNHRVIHLLQRGFFDKIVIDVLRKKIRSVSYRRKGILKTIFNYGEARIEVAGKARPFVLENIIDPRQLQYLLGIDDTQNVEHDEVIITPMTAKNLLDDEIYAILVNIKEGIGDRKFKKILNEVEESVDNDKYIDDENDETDDMSP